jgi:predicted glycoside hydrolase/deacetylase ChbG (UPF0249 family)
VRAHQQGIVTSTSLMTDRDAFDEAVTLAKANPKLGIGLHLDLDSFFKVEHGVGRLLEYKDASLPMNAIVAETERQLKKILATGLPITHVDGHHHAHLRPELFASVAALTAKYKIPVLRYFRGFYEGLYPGENFAWIPDIERRFGLSCTEVFFAGWEPVVSSLPGYSYWDVSKPFKTAELMVHPGVGEDWRERELMHCTSHAVREAIQKNGITLVSFAGWTEG